MGKKDGLLLSDDQPYNNLTLSPGLGHGEARVQKATDVSCRVLGEIPQEMEAQPMFCL